MLVGDLLEWLAAACFVAGAYCATARVWAALLVAGGCLAYLAQCYAQQSLPRPKRPRLPRPALPKRAVRWLRAGVARAFGPRATASHNDQSPPRAREPVSEAQAPVIDARNLLGTGRGTP